MTGFRGGQSNERSINGLLGWGCRSGEVVTDGDVKEEGSGEQDQGDMAIPAQIAASFRMTKSKGFARFEVFLDVPTGTDGLNHEGERGVGWGPDEEEGQHARIVEAAANQEPMTTIDLASVSNGQASPVKEALTFGAQAL